LCGGEERKGTGGEWIGASGMGKLEQGIVRTLKGRVVGKGEKHSSRTYIHKGHLQDVLSMKHIEKACFLDMYNFCIEKVHFGECFSLITAKENYAHVLNIMRLSV
jgi:hypothetical protein